MCCYCCHMYNFCKDHEMFANDGLLFTGRMRNCCCGHSCFGRRSMNMAKKRKGQLTACFDCVMPGQSTTSSSLPMLCVHWVGFY